MGEALTGSFSSTKTGHLENDYRYSYLNLLLLQIGSNYCFLFLLEKFSGGGFVNRLPEFLDALDENFTAIALNAFDNGLNVAI